MADAKAVAGSSTHTYEAIKDYEATARSLWRTIAWPLALVCGFLVFVIGSSIYLVVSSQYTSDRMNHTLLVDRKLSIVLGIARDAETGQRGYLLTGDPAYLDVYRIATNGLAPSIANLKAEIHNPSQQDALAEVTPLLERKFAEMGETIRLRDIGDAAAAVALVKTGVGRDLMTDIRARISDMREEQRLHLSRRQASSEAVGHWLLAVNLIGLALIIVLAAVSAFTIRGLAETEIAYRSDLERSNQELDDFAYIASHDLKEPLRGLFNHSTFLLEDYKDKLDEDGVRRLTRLGQLCQRMELLISDLMYLSRLGRADLAVQETDLNAVVADIQQMMETVLSERHARIVMPHPLPHIVCDKTRVTEVFRNLISNAVKYNKKAERLVEVGYLASVDTDQGQERNVFYVKDDGVGIEPEFHQDIFRLFKRLENVSDGSVAGTGVGLTFAKKIVERHHGRIWLTSKPGQGTVFYFNLDRGRNDPVRTIDENASNATPVYSAG